MIMFLVAEYSNSGTCLGKKKSGVLLAVRDTFIVEVSISHAGKIDSFWVVVTKSMNNDQRIFIGCVYPITSLIQYIVNFCMR